MIFTILRRYRRKLNPLLIKIYNQNDFSLYYGNAGYFLKKNPITWKYSYANWGARKWEYYYIEALLNKIGIKNKNIIDIGIGRPEDSNFYTFYINSGCNLLGIDLDDRLEPITILSKKCKIIKESADKIDLPKQSTDVVVALSSIEHFTYKAFLATLKKIHYILKDEGHFVVTLDMTITKKSTNWAVLERTYNDTPENIDDEHLHDNYAQITFEKFIELVSEYFYIENNDIKNNFYSYNKNLNQFVHCNKWNSIIAYFDFKKKL